MTHTPEGGTGSRSRRRAAMWYLPGDRSAPVFTARDQINSAHRKCQLTLPETAIVFFMSRGTDYLCAHYDAKELPEPFPRFLNRCPIWELGEYGVCFLDGGRGAPQAADTVETLAALGVKNILAVGMFGAFDPRLTMGEVIAPEAIPHLFERFYRTDEARSRSGAGGYGLGLSIAQTITDLHKGKISCTSTEPDGTTFLVQLPADKRQIR